MQNESGAVTEYTSWPIRGTQWKVPKKYSNLVLIGEGSFGSVCSAYDSKSGNVSDSIASFNSSITSWYRRWLLKNSTPPLQHLNMQNEHTGKWVCSDTSTLNTLFRYWTPLLPRRHSPYSGNELQFFHLGGHGGEKVHSSEYKIDLFVNLGYLSTALKIILDKR